jgi:hypothetical protein
VPNHPALGLTVRTDHRSWKLQLLKLLKVRLDITTKAGYNHEASYAADLKDATKLTIQIGLSLS